MLRAGAGRYVTNVYIVRVHCDRLHRRPCSSREEAEGNSEELLVVVVVIPLQLIYIKNSIG